MKLKAETRELLGKKVKNLRAKGQVPAAVYGPSTDNVNIVVDAKELRKVFNNVHYNKFFELEVDGKKPFTVLIKELQMHPTDDYFISVNFYAVDENRKIVVDVPVETVNEAPAVKQKIGFLVLQLETISLYALPKNIPDTVKVDLVQLATADDVITVGDIEIPENTELASNMDATSAIAYIGTAQKEEALEEAREAAAAEFAEDEDEDADEDEGTAESEEGTAEGEEGETPEGEEGESEEKKEE